MTLDDNQTDMFTMAGGEPRRWSLWEMINFSFWSTNRVLSELSVLIRLSNSNMKRIPQGAPLFGLLSSGDREKERVEEEIDNIIKTIECVVSSSEQLFSRLRCGHIDAAIKKLAYLKNKDKLTWSELNTRSRALRDAVETELKEYYFYQYPKSKGLKMVHIQGEWKAPAEALTHNISYSKLVVAAPNAEILLNGCHILGDVVH